VVAGGLSHFLTLTLTLTLTVTLTIASPVMNCVKSCGSPSCHARLSVAAERMRM
jgi:hypothetical protein